MISTREISQLDAASPMLTDQVPAVQVNQTVRETLNSIMLLFAANFPPSSIPNSAIAPGGAGSIPISSLAAIPANTILGNNTGGSASPTPLTASQVASMISALTTPIGSMLDFAGNVAPTGFLACDGSAVSRVTYSALFAVISTIWGIGDGSTTFNLPDFRRRTAVGSGGSGSGVLGNAVGDVGGAETHVQTISEMAAHTHSITGGAGGGVTDAAGVPVCGTVPVGASNVISVTFNPVSGKSLVDQWKAGAGATATDSAGSSAASTLMQPSGVVLKIIKY